MTPRAPRISAGRSGASYEDYDRFPGEFRRPKELRLPGADSQPIRLGELQRYALDQNRTPVGAANLRLFQDLPARGSGRELGVGREGPISFLRKIYEAWRSGSHGAPLLMGAAWLLGAGPVERIRSEDDFFVLSYREGESPISLGRISETAPDHVVGPALDFFDRKNVSHKHAELFRQGNHLYVRDLGSRNGTWLWKNGRWLRVAPEVPQLLERGAILALGGRPGLRQILALTRRGREPDFAVLRFEPGRLGDAFRIRQIQAKSLDHFLGELEWHGALFADSRAWPPAHKEVGEVLGLALRFGLRRELFRLKVAQRLFRQGYPREALVEMEKVESFLQERLGKIPSSAYGKMPEGEEKALRRGLGDLYSEKGFLLQGIQEPEAAAVAFGKAAQQWRRIGGSDFSLSLHSHLAFRLYYQQAERAFRSGRWIEAALAYEQAAGFSEEAKRYLESPVIEKFLLTPFPPETYLPASLLEKAAQSFLRAGPELREEYLRVIRNLEILRGLWEGVFR